MAWTSISGAGWGWEGRVQVEECQHDEADELVLQSRGLVGDVDGFVKDLVDEGNGIDFSAGALIDAFFEEDGVLSRVHRPGRWGW